MTPATIDLGQIDARNLGQIDAGIHRYIVMSIEGRGSEGGRNGGGVWQTYLRLGQHWSSSHLPAGLPQLNDRQFWLPPELLGCPGCQLVYDSGVLDGLHTHVPSEAASVPPIHTALPAAAVSSSAFSAAVCTLASCRPAARQAALASLHDRASFISVYTGGEGEGEGGGGTALAAIIASWTSIAYRVPCIDLYGNTLLG